MSMYDDKTHDSILEEMQDEVVDDMEDGKDIDVSDGSLAFNNMSATAYECEKLYRQIDYHTDELDPEKTDYEGMVLLAKMRYLTPRDPTYAVGKMTCVPAIPTGLRFSIGDYTYEVTGAYDDGTYACTCEQSGSGPNSVLGAMEPIDFIDGFKNAELVEITTKGQDAETKDELKARFYANLHADSFAGNASAYEAYCLNYGGVGGVRVKRREEGGSTVKIVLLDPEYKPVTATFCENLLKEICPAAGEGKGMAPIGADIEIEPAESVTLNITGTFTVETGTTFDAIKDGITQAAETYISSIRKDWNEGDTDTSTVVYASRLISAMLDVSGLVDVSDMKINGTSGNLTLAWNQVPMLGGITNG